MLVEVLSGVLSGIVSALGMGGGTILIIILSIFMGMYQHEAQAINMIFFIPVSITAIIINIKNKNIVWNIAKTIIPFGIIGAVIGSFISINMDTHLLRKIFGFFLLIITIYEIFTLWNMHKNNIKRHNKI